MSDRSAVSQMPFSVSHILRKENDLMPTRNSSHHKGNEEKKAQPNTEEKDKERLKPSYNQVEPKSEKNSQALNLAERLAGKKRAFFFILIMQHVFMLALVLIMA